MELLIAIIIFNAIWFLWFLFYAVKKKRDKSNKMLADLVSGLILKMYKDSEEIINDISNSVLTPNRVINTFLFLTIDTLTAYGINQKTMSNVVWKTCYNLPARAECESEAIERYAAFRKLTDELSPVYERSEKGVLNISSVVCEEPSVEMLGIIILFHTTLYEIMDDFKNANI